MQSFFKRFLGSRNDREVARLMAEVGKINAFEADLERLSDDQLKAKTQEFRERLEKSESLDGLLHEAFACVREASKRHLKLRHYDVQMVGGMALHQGKIAEMKTGEGKTLMSTLPIYLNALSGKGVHLVTVNDYLAKRDAEWMGPIYEALGMSVGVIVHGIDDVARKAAYACDITYGTNNEFGFDYLRDNMKVQLENLCQRELNYAIVDEVDSILIDEARTPLIISGPSTKSSDKYSRLNRVIPFLKREVHYTMDEKSRTVHLTDEGVEEVQKRLGVDNLYDPRHMETLHHVDQALKAHVMFKKDVDYVVKDGQVIIVDEFTGRLAPGRRYGDGLHQALEAKEGVQVATENQTLASITYQNYFRMYSKLAGMTGTAETEAEEFASIYKLDVLVIPTHRPMIRIDHSDVIYKTSRARDRAVAEDIKERHQKGQPVLVGTVSIEKSERLSELLKKESVPHHVLNAKHHEKEAQIVAAAGQKGSVTIATNMAGRGTDIKLEEGVADLGGLYIVGCERHEARRIDNQLRGRSGRQGDPGESRFYLSLEDQMLRVFAGDRMMKIMNFFGMEEDEPIEARMISKSIEDAQTRMEGRNFDTRKHLLKYDDVMNHQRKVVYQWRRKLLGKEDVRTEIQESAEEVIGAICEEHIPPKAVVEDWDWSGLKESMLRFVGEDLGLDEIQKEIEDAPPSTADQKLFEAIVTRWEKYYGELESELTPELLRRRERVVFLHTLDDRWREHLLNMDHLREGINLRGYAQKDPVLDYQKESFRLFELMFARVKQEGVERLNRLKALMAFEEAQRMMSPEMRRQKLLAEMDEEQRLRSERARKLAEASSAARRGGQASAAKPETMRRQEEKVGRNDPCPCGSGKKFKKCHGISSSASLQEKG
ncbi:MAG: preprotein translocase subunit SecA [Bradymonadales bacterium]|nr:MAG: preprotein translocase subunit SecA [Bradymonadales bacterium]